mmetsp:Transcript_25823/g.65653  ORF Transcript_25823/g.65653 Transcript_25823/m.65653 type:complete len:215 (+) Transcript_25823:365-1009(+)
MLAVDIKALGRSWCEPRLMEDVASLVVRQLVAIKIDEEWDDVAHAGSDWVTAMLQPAWKGGDAAHIWRCNAVSKRLTLHTHGTHVGEQGAPALILRRRVEGDGEGEVGRVLMHLEACHAICVVARDKGVVAAQHVRARNGLRIERLEHGEESRPQPVFKPLDQAGHLTQPEPIGESPRPDHVGTNVLCIRVVAQPTRFGDLLGLVYDPRTLNRW